MELALPGHVTFVPSYTTFAQSSVTITAVYLKIKEATIICLIWDNPYTLTGGVPSSTVVKLALESDLKEK